MTDINYVYRNKIVSYKCNFTHMVFNNYYEIECNVNVMEWKSIFTEHPVQILSLLMIRIIITNEFITV